MALLSGLKLPPLRRLLHHPPPQKIPDLFLPFKIRDAQRFVSTWAVRRAQVQPRASEGWRSFGFLPHTCLRLPTTTNKNPGLTHPCPLRLPRSQCRKDQWQLKN